MTRIIGVPHPERALDDLKRRVYNLERRLRPEALGRPREEEPHPSVTVRRNTHQAIPDATDTTIVWDGVVGSDPLGMWNGTDGMVAKEAGVYAVWYSVKWDTNETGQRSVHLAVTRASGVGPIVIIDDHQAASSPLGGIVGQSSSRPFRLGVGDVVRVTVLQQTSPASTLDVLSTGAHSPRAGLQWMSA